MDTMVPLGAPLVAYTVTCRFTGEAEAADKSRRLWLTWLTDDGHMMEVLHGGAIRSAIVKLDTDDRCVVLSRMLAALATD